MKCGFAIRRLDQLSQLLKASYFARRLAFCLAIAEPMLPELLFVLVHPFLIFVDFGLALYAPIPFLSLKNEC